mmetsp:Transcript_31999/g.63007  ORF Transcript_31999/g.63007 Transcript_31999/m.63007 type:complete len:80 (+) Transcript_31999:55-294(+)
MQRLSACLLWIVAAEQYSLVPWITPELEVGPIGAAELSFQVLRLDHCSSQGTETRRSEVVQSVALRHRLQRLEELFPAG